MLSWFVSQKFFTLLARGTKEDLTIVRELMKAGKVTPVIVSCWYKTRRSAVQICARSISGRAFIAVRSAYSLLR